MLIVTKAYEANKVLLFFFFLPLPSHHVDVNAILKGLSWADQKYMRYCKSKAWWCLELYNVKLSAGAGDALPYKPLDLLLFFFSTLLDL